MYNYFYVNGSSCKLKHDFITSVHKHHLKFYNAIATKRHGQQGVTKSMCFSQLENHFLNDGLVFCGAACNIKNYKRVTCYIYDLAASQMLYITTPSKVFFINYSSLISNMFLYCLYVCRYTRKK